MTCYHPLQAYQCSDGSVVFAERRGRDHTRSLQLPCGQCVGCRLERSRQWAVRCLNEASLYGVNNSFVTLTYKDTGPSLNYRDYQLFMRRLRKVRTGVRFFMCGEYGETTGRPHFHACLFNCFFDDREWFARGASGFNVYRSPLLERLWPHGHSSIGDVTFESAAYCARYVMKKLTGDGEDSYYNIFDPSTGEIWKRLKEFCHMSLKPGIGARWLDKYLSDVYPDGTMIVNGATVFPPKYYDRRFRKLDGDGDAWSAIQLKRERMAKLRFEDSSDERLRVREQVVSARLSFLKRSL